MHSLKTLLLLAGSVTVAFSFPVKSMAADRTITTSIEVTQEYNDNIFFDKEKKSDFIIRIKPKVRVSNDTERTQMRFDAALNGEKYLKNPGLDTVQADTQFSVSRAWSPRLSTALRGYFRRDETLETELELAGVPSLRQERLQYGTDLSGTYAITEKWSVKATAATGLTNYPEGLLPDVKYMEGQLDQSWQLTPRTAVGVLGKYSVADYEDAPKSASVEDASNKTLLGNVYWRHQHTENTSLEASVGYRFTWIDRMRTYTRFVITPVGIFPVLFTEPQSSTDAGLIFGLSAKTKWSERVSASLSAGREQYNAADATSVERNFIRSALQYQFTDRTWLDFGQGYDYTVEDSPSDQVNHYVRSSLALNYKLTETIAAQIGGSYEFIMTDNNGSDYDRNRFRTWISLSTEWPRLFSNN